MKIFLIDEKHERVNGEFDIGEVTSAEERKIESILEWMNGHSSHYHQYHIGNDVRFVPDPDGDGGIVEVL